MYNEELVRKRELLFNPDFFYLYGKKK